MSISSELLAFVSPLATALTDEQSARGLLRDLELIAHRDSAGAIPQTVLDVGQVANDVVAALQALDDEDKSAAEKWLQAVAAVDDVLSLLRSLEVSEDEDLTSYAYPFDHPDAWNGFAHTVPAYLLGRWLRTYHPRKTASLELFDVFDDNGQGGVTVDFGRLGEILADPVANLADIVRRKPLHVWRPLSSLAAATGIAVPARRYDSEHEVTLPEDAPREPPAPPGFGAALVSRLADQDWAIELELVMPPAGNGVQVNVLPNWRTDISAPLGGPWTIEASTDAVDPFGVVLTPDGIAPAETTAADTAYLSLVGSPDDPWTLIGSAEATRLELTALSFELDATKLLSAPDIAAMARTDGLRLVLTAGDADSFLADVFGGGEVSADASLSLAWSTQNGLVFGAAAGFDVIVAVEKSLGPVTFETIRISLGADESGLSSELAASVTVTIGPLDVLVEDVGMAASMLPAASPGHGAFGEVDFSIAFKPPTGLGLSVDAGVVQGGGFISHDVDLARYAGAAELTVINTGIAAVGVLITRMPYGSDGWSMFMSLSARFVGVQLGFGFTLNGVGGLVGIHRGLDEDALGEAVRTGSLDTILFPEDAVADAMRILADIDAIFPPARDQYVFGPVVKIGWGTPTLVELDVGVAIQLPEPLTISVLGALSAILPDEAAPVLELRAAFAGTVNLTEGTLKIDASLSGSQVAGLVITGDMAVRMEFYGSPSFLLAFGGFHPAFDPPACFPVLERLGIAVDAGETLQLALGGYFALSSNSIQFGAFADFYISEVGFTAEGGTSFDALIIYRPFSFSIRLSLWVSVSASGGELMCVLLEGSLTGPNPWQAVGAASFKLLGIKVNINIEVTFGDRESQGIVATVDVQILLVEALEQDDACQLLAPDGEAAVIMSSDQEEVRLDPAGRIRVAQRITPLDLEIERYGHEALADERVFSIAAAGFDEDETEAVEDWFGTEHYFELDNAERLSAPSFTERKSGITIGSSKALAPAARSLTYDFEIAYKDPAATTPKRSFGNAQVAQLDRALAARAAPAERQRFTVKEEAFTVRDAMSGGVEEAVGEVEGNYFEARTALFASGASTGVVVPTYELELAG